MPLGNGNWQSQRKKRSSTSTFSVESYYRKRVVQDKWRKETFAVLLTSPSDKIQAQSRVARQNHEPDLHQIVLFPDCLRRESTNNFRSTWTSFANDEFPTLKTFNAIQFLDRQEHLNAGTYLITMQFIIESKRSDSLWAWIRTKNPLFCRCFAPIDIRSQTTRKHGAKNPKLRRTIGAFDSAKTERTRHHRLPQKEQWRHDYFQRN